MCQTSIVVSHQEALALMNELVDEYDNRRWPLVRVTISFICGAWSAKHGR